MTLADMPETLVWAYLFALGACVGSFIGVVVARLPQGLSVVRPRSRCDACRTVIAWYDNIPLLSQLILQGRCRHCRVAIGARSALLEGITGLLFVALGCHMGLSLQLVWWLVFVSGLIAITFLDIDHFWVPDAITYPLMGWALLATALPHGPALKSALWGLLPALLLWGVAQGFYLVTGKEGLGLGDIKLLAAMGLMMGLPATLTLLFLASAQGAVLGSIILAFGGHKERIMPAAEVSLATPAAAQGGEQGAPIVLADVTLDSTSDAAEGADGAGDAGVDDDAEPWTPDPKAIPFGPFLVLGTLEVLFYPEVFVRLFNRLMSFS